MKTIRRQMNNFISKIRTGSAVTGVLCMLVVLAVVISLVTPAETLDAKTAAEQGGIDLVTMSTETGDEEAKAAGSADQSAAEEETRESGTVESEEAVQEKEEEAGGSQQDSAAKEAAGSSEAAGSEKAGSAAAASGTDAAATETEAAAAEAGAAQGQGLLTFEGKNYKVTVLCSEEAGVPADAELSVTELVAGKKEAKDETLEYRKDYGEYVTKTEDALGWEEGSASYIRLFDIKIVSGGEKVEIAAPVDVTIELTEDPSEAGASEEAQVVHFPDDSDRGDVVPSAFEEGTVSFEAEGFSIYAVADSTKRLVYHFYNGSSLLASEYIKSGENLYDPGVTSQYGQTFLGWAYDAGETDAEKIYTIRELNEQAGERLEAGDFEDGDAVSVYAIFTEAWCLRYMTQDESGDVTVLQTVSVRQDAADKNVTIDYTPVEEAGQVFEGWIDVATGTVYQEGDTLTLDQHVDLYLKVQGRSWLVFDANAGGSGSGATYTPPQLLIGEDAVTERPADPTRKGYSFKGWNTKADGSGEWWYKADGSVDAFGSGLTEDTTLYAQWEADDTDYYVIFWRQKASDEAGLADEDKTYDYIESVQRTALTDSTATLTTADKTKSTGEYLHCTMNTALSDTEMTVAADGTTILNVYYDREEYSLTFQVPAGNQVTGTSGTQYGVVNGQLTQIYYSERGRYWYYKSGRNNYQFVGTKRFDSNKWKTIKTITALYEHSVAGEFPIVGTDGITYNNGDRWLAQNGSTFSTSDVLVTVDNMPAESVTFHWNDPDTRPLKTMNYYVQELEEEDPEYTYPGYTSEEVSDSEKTTSYGGYDFILYNQIKARYNMVTESEDYLELTGFTKWTSDPAYVNGVALNGSSHDGTINMYYTRNQYTIHFISQGSGVTTRSEKEDDEVYYEASLSGYGQQADGSWYYEPTNGKDGYVFTGWYADEALTVPYDFDTRMPAGDVTLYAKWENNRVRVVLVPTANGANNDEVYFPNEQALTFRLDYSEKVSDSNINSDVAKRTGYKLIGWYTSPTFEEETLWNFDTEVNRSVAAVDMEYQNSEDWANNTYGDNDGKNDNVKGILKLYAKWVLDVDESSLYLEYDVEEEYRVYDAAGNLQTTIPVDAAAYLIPTEDKPVSATIAQAPAGYADGFSFSSWELLNSDGSASGITFTPGDTWNLPVNYEQYLEERTLTDDEGNTATMKVLRIRANFEIEEENKATMVTFDGNGGVTNDSAAKSSVTETVTVNKDFTMPEEDSFVRTGYTLLGWAFAREDGSKVTASAFRSAVESAGEGPDALEQLAEAGIFLPGQTVAADNLTLSSENNWEPLENTVYAVWEPHTTPITIIKTDQTGAALEGATFDFVGEDFSGTDDETTWTSTIEGSGASGDASDDAVIIEDNAVPLGSYELAETETPAGYQPLEGNVKIEVSASDDTDQILVKATINGEESSFATATLVDSNDESQGWQVRIMNSAGVELPHTGGMGTHLIYLLGMLLMLGSGGLLAVRRRLRA